MSVPHLVCRKDLTAWLSMRKPSYQGFLDDWAKAAQRKCGKFPLRLDMELTGRCGLRCAGCPRTAAVTAGMRLDDMKPAMFYKCLGEAETHGVRSIRFNHRGDSLLMGSEHMYQYVSYAKACRNVCETWLSTNGTMLSHDTSMALLEARLDVLQVYFVNWPDWDMPNAESSPAAEAVGNLRHFIELRNARRFLGTMVKVNLVNAAVDRNRACDFVKTWHELADEVTMVTSENAISDDSIRTDTEDVCVPPPVTAPAMSDDVCEPRISKPTKDQPQTVVKPLEKPPEVVEVRRTTTCASPWQRLTVLYDGTVVACTRDIYGALPVGDANHDLLYAIWNGKVMKSLRTALIEGRVDSLKSCKGCSAC